MGKSKPRSIKWTNYTRTSKLQMTSWEQNKTDFMLVSSFARFLSNTDVIRKTKPICDTWNCRKLNPKQREIAANSDTAALNENIQRGHAVVWLEGHMQTLLPIGKNIFSAQLAAHGSHPSPEATTDRPSMQKSDIWQNMWTSDTVSTSMYVSHTHAF